MENYRKAQVIKCKCGNIFAASLVPYCYADAEWQKEMRKDIKAGHTVDILPITDFKIESCKCDKNPFNEKIDFTQIDNITTLGAGVDKYIMTADYRGVEMTDDQVEYINAHHSEFIQEYPIY